MEDISILPEVPSVPRGSLSLGGNHCESINYNRIIITANEICHYVLILKPRNNYFVTFF